MPVDSSPTSVFNRGIRLRIGTVLRLVVLAIAAGSILAYAKNGTGHPYFNRTGLGLTMTLAAVLFAFSGRFSTRYPLTIIVTTMVVLFVQLRLWVLIFLPESLLHNARVEARHFNSMVEYIIFGTVSCYLGCAAGQLRFIGRRARRAWRQGEECTLVFFLVAFVCAMLFTLWVYFDLGYAGATGSGSHLGFFQRYLARLVAPTAWLVMVVAAYMLQPNRVARIWALFGAIGVYVLGLMLQGSRSGVFESIMLLLAAKVFFDGNFSIAVKGRHLLMVLVGPPIALLTFQIPTQLREHWYDANFSATQHLWRVVSGQGDPLIDDETISNISYRLSFIEPTLFPMHAEELGLSSVSDLVNVRTTTLSSLNRLIPGKPLGDILFTEYAFGFMYDPQDGIRAYSADGRVDRVGYEWSIYGISYQLFGFVGGGVFIFLATGVLAKVIWLFANRRDLYGACYGLYFMTLFVVWLRNLGIDNFVDRTAHGFAVLLIYAALYWAMTQRDIAKLARIKRGIA